MDPNHTLDSPQPETNWPRINQWLLWLGLAAAVGWHGGHGKSHESHGDK